MRPRIKQREVEKPGSAAFLMSGQMLLVLPIMLCLFFSVVVDLLAPASQQTLQSFVLPTLFDFIISVHADVLYSRGCLSSYLNLLYNTGNLSSYRHLAMHIFS